MPKDNEIILFLSSTHAHVHTGQCMQMSSFIFIKRKWEEDKIEFRDKLYYLNAIDYPVQLLLFPEGGDFTPKTKKRSDKYAEENNLPALDYCLHPHTTGFKYAVNALREGNLGLDAIYDLTIAYPDVLPKTEVDVGHGILPREVHFHVKKHDDEDIPRGQAELEMWLQDRWLEKEERLKNFYQYKEFREEPGEAECSNGIHFDNHSSHCNGKQNRTSASNGHAFSEANCNGKHTGNGSTTRSINGISTSSSSPHTLKSPEVVRPRNIPYFLYSVFIFISTNLLMFVPMYYSTYYCWYMFFGTIFLAFGHYWKGMGHLYMLFKRKEIAREIAKSKLNQ